MAAVLSSGPGSAASHATAAHLHGLHRDRPDEIEVTGPTRVDRARQFRRHRSADLTSADVGSWRGIPVTTPVRTFIDVGCQLGPYATAAIYEECIRRRWFDLEEAGEAIDRIGRRGRNGAGVARSIVAERAELDTLTDSHLEARFLDVVRMSELPMPVAQLEVYEGDRFVCRVDFAWPDVVPMVTVELDSEAHHLDRLVFRKDREKDRSLRRLGHIPLRFTAWDVRFGSHRIRSDLAAFLTPKSAVNLPRSATDTAEFGRAVASRP